MEVLGFSIVCSIFSFIGVKFKNMGIKGILKSVIDSAGGEALEELIEAMLNFIFPKILPYVPRTRLSKQRQRLSEQLNAAFSGMSEADGQALLRFFEKHSISRKNGAIHCENINDPGAVKLFCKALKKQYKESKNKATESIHFKTGEALVRDVYGITDESEQIPAVVLKLSDLVSRHVYESLYVGLSSDDRDLAKVIQFMMVSNNKQMAGTVREELRDMLQETLSIILQHHEDGTLAAIDVRERVPKDPFFYIKLVCPDCGATADYVHRRGDRVFCRCCGGSYDIVQNAEPEVVKRIAQLERHLERQLKENGTEISAQLHRQLHEMAEKTVSAEYFEKKFAALREGISEDGRQTAQGVTLSVQQMEERLAQRMEGLKAYMAQLQKQEAIETEQISQAVVAALHRENQSLHTQAEMMQSQLTQIGAQTERLGTQTAEMLSLVRRMIELNREDESVRQTVTEFVNGMQGMLQHEMKNAAEDREIKHKEVMTALRVSGKKDEIRANCPVCGGNESFIHREGENAYHCSVCDAILKNTTDTVPVKAPVLMELIVVKGRACLQFAPGMWEKLQNSGDRSTLDLKTAKIQLRFSELPKLATILTKGEISMPKEIKEAQRMLPFYRVILYADSGCRLSCGKGERNTLGILQELLGHFKILFDTVQELVLGRNVTIKDKEIWDSTCVYWKQDGAHSNVFKLRK